MSIPPMAKTILTTAAIAIIAVALWNRYGAPKLGEKVGKDLTA